MIDIHSHILPEVDDGARTMDEALEMARLAVADGIQQMVCTPHMFNGISNNPEPAEIIERVAVFQAAIDAQSGGKGLRVLPGNEVHISHEIAEQVRVDRVTRLNQQNYMLVEFPSMSVPVGVEELFYRLQLAGVRPILVHPERNTQLQAQPGRVSEFVERGVYIQVTAMSVTGQFGMAARAFSEDLLRHNCVHFLATDTHRAERRPPILSGGRDAASVIVGEEKARKLVYDNPLAVIHGQPIQAEPPLPWSASRPAKKSIFSRLFGK